jgi:hypothetical protein
MMERYCEKSMWSNILIVSALLNMSAGAFLTSQHTYVHDLEGREWESLHERGDPDIEKTEEKKEELKVKIDDLYQELLKAKQHKKGGHGEIAEGRSQLKKASKDLDSAEARIKRAKELDAKAENAASQSLRVKSEQQAKEEIVDAEKKVKLAEQHVEKAQSIAEEVAGSSAGNGTGSSTRNGNGTGSSTRNGHGAGRGVGGSDGHAGSGSSGNRGGDGATGMKGAGSDSDGMIGNGGSKGHGGVGGRGSDREGAEGNRSSNGGRNSHGGNGHGHGGIDGSNAFASSLCSVWAVVPTVLVCFAW